MTDKEKARAYDEALEQAKKELATCGSMDCDAARQIFRFFPELRESEDERIRKELVAFFKGMQDSDWHEKYWHDLEIDRILAYLEKQKEQKPSWSEEDEKMRDRLITRLNWITYNTSTNGTSPNITFFDEIAWLKSLLEQSPSRSGSKSF